MRFSQANTKSAKCLYHHMPCPYASRNSNTTRQSAHTPSSRIEFECQCHIRSVLLITPRPARYRHCLALQWLESKVTFIRGLSLKLGRIQVEHVYRIFRQIDYELHSSVYSIRIYRTLRRNRKFVSPFCL